MKKIIIASALFLALTGCNTFRGIGEDMQSVGRWTSSSAEKTSSSLDGSGPSRSSNSVSSKITPIEDSYTYPGDRDTKYLN